MKTILLVLALFSLAVSAISQQPAVKFYLEDGTTKEYNIDDIDSFAVSKDNLYVMHIYYQDTKIAYYPNEIIQSVKIEKDTSRQLYLNVYIYGYPKPYLVSDIDSIVFKIDKRQPLTIGTQVWMLKNLDVDHYRNGDSIPEVKDTTEWSKLIIGAWCYYNNDPVMGAIYGKLYNWFTVDDTRGLAPIGWHVSTDAEWTALIKYLGEESVAGGKIKEAGTKYWLSPNTGATNESGFSALPGGWRYLNGTLLPDGWSYNIGSFYSIGQYGVWWSSFEVNEIEAWFISLNCYRTDILYRQDINKALGFSVRCVKDGK